MFERSIITKDNLYKGIALLLAVMMLVGIVALAVDSQPIAAADDNVAESAAELYEEAEDEYEPPVEDELPVEPPVEEPAPPVAPAEPEVLPIVPPIGVVPPFEPEQPSDGDNLNADDLDLPEDGYIGIAPLNLLNDPSIMLQILNPITGTYNPAPTAWVATDFDGWPTMTPDFASIAALPHHSNIDWTQWRVSHWTLGVSVSAGPGIPMTYTRSQLEIRTGPIYHTFPQYVYENFYRLHWGTNPIFRAYLVPLPLIDIPVEKVWECDCEEEHEPVEVHLLRRLYGQDESYNVLHEVRFLSPYDNWEHEFINLPQYYTTMQPLYSHRNIWTIYEANPPSGYEPEVVPNNPHNPEDGYRIINRPMRAPPPELSIEKQVRNHGAPESANADSLVANVGETVTYTIRVENTGGSAATNFQIIDNLVATVGPNISNARNLVVQVGPTSAHGGTSRAILEGNILEVDVLRLEAGGYILITFDATVMNVDSTRGNAHTNTAILRQPGEDDKTSTATVEVPRLTIEKTVNGQDRYYGTLASNEINYLITVRNVSQYSARGFRVVDYMNPIVYYDGGGYIVLPAASAIEVRLNGTPLSPADFTLNLTPFGALTVEFIEIPAGGEVTIMVPATLHPNVRNSMTGQEFDNLARLYNPYYILEGYCYAEVILPDLRAPGLRIEKLVNGEDEIYANVGDVLYYTIEVRNDGTAAATGVQVIDNLQHLAGSHLGNINVVSVEGTSPTGEVGTSWSLNNNIITVNIPTFPIDGVILITFRATVLESAADTEFTNTAILRQPGEDDQTSTSTVRVPEMTIAKTVNGGDLYEGDENSDEINYVITVTNTSDFDAVGFQVVDDMSHLLGYIDLPNENDVVVHLNSSPMASSEYTVTLVGGVLTVDFGTIPAGGVVTITVPALLRADLEMAGQYWDNTARLYGPERYDGGRNFIEDDYAKVNLPDLRAPGLSIDKYVNYMKLLNANVGDVIYYTIIVRNTGNAAAENLTVIDNLNHLIGSHIGNLSIVDTVATANSSVQSSAFNSATNILTVRIGTLAPNGTVTITLRAVVLEGAAGTSFTNTATLYNEDDYYEDSSSSTVRVPRMGIVKTVNGVNTYYGDENSDDIEYVITVTNLSPYMAYGFRVIDDMSHLLGYINLPDASEVLVTGTTANVTIVGGVLIVDLGYVSPAPNGVVTITVPARLVNGFELEGQSWTNVARLYGPERYDGGRNFVEDDDAHVTLPDPRTPEVSIEKRVNGEESIVADVGEVIYYTIVVRNDGTEAATGLVVTDDLNHLIGAYIDSVSVVSVVGTSPTEPVGTSWGFNNNVVTVNIPRLPIDGVVTITVRATVLAEAAGESFTNTARLTQPGEDDQTSTSTVQVPNMALNKYVNTLGQSIYDVTAYPSTVTYRLLVTNTSNVAATGFIVRDDLSALVGTYLNPDITSADVTVVAPHTGTVTVVNNVVQVVLGTVQPGATVEITITADLLEGIMFNGQSFDNVARLYTPSSDTYPDGRFIEDDTARVNIPSPVLEILKQVNRNADGTGGAEYNVTYAGNRDLEFVITVTNTSPYPARGWSVVDDLGGWIGGFIEPVTVGDVTVGGAGVVSQTPTIAGSMLTVEFDYIPANGTATITINAELLEDLTMMGQVFNNTAYLYNPDREPEDDSTVTVRLPGTPKFEITKVVNNVDRYTVTAETASDRLVYTITVTNISNAPGAGFVVRDDLSRLIEEYLADFTLTDVTVSPASASTSMTLVGGVLTVVLGEVGAGESVTITINAYLYEGLELHGQEFDNTAVLHHPDGTPVDNDYAEVELPDVRRPDLRIVKGVNGEFEDEVYSLVDERIRYTIRVHNYGDATAYNFRIVDDLSDLIANRFIDTLALVSVIGGDVISSTLDPSTHTLTVLVASLAPGGTVTITVDATVVDGALGMSFTNIAQLYEREYDTYGYYTYRETDRDDSTVRVPELSIEKVVNGLDLYIGDDTSNEIEFLITVTNRGNVTADGFRVVDAELARLVANGYITLPSASEIIVELNGNPWTSNYTVNLTAAGVLTVELGAVPAGGIVTIRVPAELYENLVKSGQKFYNIVTLYTPPGTNGYRNPVDDCRADVELPDLREPGLYITKLVNGYNNEIASVGERVRYTIVVENIGDTIHNIAATNIRVVDDLTGLPLENLALGNPSFSISPAGSAAVSTPPTIVDGVLTFDIDRLDIGGAITIYFYATVTADAEGETIVNTARLYRDGDETPYREDTATVQIPEMILEKVVNNEDLYEGEHDSHEIEYVITVRNISDVPAYRFKVVDDYLALLYAAGYITLPDESEIVVEGAPVRYMSLSPEGVLTVELGLVPDGGVVTITIPATLRNGLKMTGQIFDNTAKLYSPPLEDGLTRMVMSYDNAIVKLPDTRPPWLNITKTGTPSPVVNVGDTITYTIVVGNSGYVTAYDFYMVDDLRDRDGTALVGTYLTNISNIAIVSVQPNVSAADLGTPSFEDNVITVPIYRLDVGARVYITFEATVLPGAAGASFTNVARLADGYGYTMYNSEWRYRYDENGEQVWYWGQERGNDDNNEYLDDDATKRVLYEDEPNPVLNITKRVNDVSAFTVPQGGAGSTLRYTITVTNISQYPGTGFRVVDDLSRLIGTYLANFTLADVTIPDGSTATLNDGVLTVVLGTVNPGETVTITINTQLRSGLTMNGQNFTNTAVLRTPATPEHPNGLEAGRDNAVVVLPTAPGGGTQGGGNQGGSNQGGGNQGSGNKRLPQTGIESDTGLWSVLLVISLLLMARVIIGLKKTNPKEDTQ